MSSVNQNNEVVAQQQEDHEESVVKIQNSRHARGKDDEKSGEGGCGVDDDETIAAAPAVGAAFASAHATPTTTTINLICNILGGGVLALPEVFYLMSVVPAIFLVSFMGVCTIGSIIMIIAAVDSSGLFTYRELIAHAFPRPWMSKAFEFLLFFYTYGVLIEYAKLVAQIMPPAASHISGGDPSSGHDDNTFYTTQWFWLLLAFPAFWGLTSLRHLAHLRWTSYLGIATISYVIFLIIFRFFTRSPGVESVVVGSSPGHQLISDDVDYFTFRPRFLKGLPIVSVVFNVLYNIPAYYGELENRNPKKFLKCVFIAIPLALVAYIVSGLFGYLRFGSQRVKATHGNIMTAFSTDDTPVTAGILGLFAHFCTVFPITALACRRCVNQILFNTPDQSYKVYVIEAFILVSTASLFAYFIDGVAVIFEVSGSLFATTIVYIGPAAIFLRICCRDRNGSRGDDDRSRKVRTIPSSEKKKEQPPSEVTSLLGAREQTSKGDDEAEGDNHASRLSSPAASSTFLSIKVLRPAAQGFIVGGAVVALAGFITTCYGLATS